MAEPTKSQQLPTAMMTLVTVATFLTLTSFLKVSGVSGQQCARVTTFNTGLTPAVAGVDRRQKMVEKAIQNSPADVMCLQEVWYESSVQSITTATTRQFPYHYSPLHRRVNQLTRRPVNSWISFSLPDSPCTSSEINYVIRDIGSCVVRNLCLPGNMGPCMTKNCYRELKSYRLSQSCMSCLVFSLASLRDTMSKCGNVPGAPKSRFNGPGLLLLSKKPMTQVRYVDFNPGKKVFFQRGYIEAKIEGMGKVICTHLSANVGSYYEFDLSYTSYEEQNAGEIAALSKQRYSDHILMGDLNTGPTLTFFNDEARNIDGEFPNNYKKLTDLGYRSPFVEQVRLCTYCRTNRLTKGTSHILDHVMFYGKGYTAFVSRRTMINQDRQVLSDHYGVEVQFCPIGYSQRAAPTTQPRGGFFQRLFSIG